MLGSDTIIFEEYKMYLFYEFNISNKYVMDYVKIDLSKIGTLSTIDGQSIKLYTYEDLELMHKHTQWAKYNIKHFLVNYIKVIPLDKYTDIKEKELFNKLEMRVQFF